MERYFFASLLSAMDIVFLSHFGNISRQTSLKALQNVFLACLSDSLDEIAFSVSIGKSKSMIGQNGSSPSIISCRECPSRSESIASISSALSAPRKCLSLTLLSRILYRHLPTFSVLNPCLYGADMSR